MHPYICVYTVTKCNMHNLSEFVQGPYIREQTYPHLIIDNARLRFYSAVRLPPWLLVWWVRPLGLVLGLEGC